MVTSTELCAEPGLRKRRVRGWTREQIVSVLRDAGKERGRWWTGSEWTKAHRQPCSYTVWRLLGSWSDAWVEAGYPPDPHWISRKPRHQGFYWTKDDIIQALQRASEGQFLSINRYNKMLNRGFDGPCQGTIGKLFGSWAAAKLVASIPPKQTWSEDQILEMVADCWRTLGHFPTRTEWENQQGRTLSYWVVFLRSGNSQAKMQNRVLARHPDLPRGRVTHSQAIRHLLSLPGDMLTTQEKVLVNGFAMGKTLAEMGSELHLSRERIRQIASRAGRQRRVSRAATHLLALPSEVLTPQQQEIIRGLIGGKNLSAIAVEMNLTRQKN